MNQQKPIKWVRKVQKRKVISIPTKILEILGDPEFISWKYENGAITVEKSD